MGVHNGREVKYQYRDSLLRAYLVAPHYVALLSLSEVGGGDRSCFGEIPIYCCV